MKFSTKMRIVRLGGGFIAGIITAHLGMSLAQMLITVLIISIILTVVTVALQARYGEE